jgi:sensor histidine kinase regulating citrate/malate metabolism
VVNESFEVQQVNEAAMDMLKIARESDVLGEQLVRILDPLPFSTCFPARAFANSGAITQI